jgi:hypothetical protein
MKKEQIYVTIDTEEKRLRAIEILEKAGERIYNYSEIYIANHYHKYLELYDGHWLLSRDAFTTKQEITLDQLESLLLPNYQVKDVILSLDELKSQAAALGFELVEKPYEPKVGDFGVFWDGDKKCETFGFLGGLMSRNFTFMRNDGVPFRSFRKLTEEEKTKIQEAW